MTRTPWRSGGGFDALDPARLLGGFQLERTGQSEVEVAASAEVKKAIPALAALAQIQVPADNRFFRFQYDYTKADAYVAAGVVDSARTTLEGLSQAFPNNPRIKQRLEQLPH